MVAETEDVHLVGEGAFDGQTSGQDSVRNG
jgi:hypothetical protein